MPHTFISKKLSAYLRKNMNAVYNLKYCCIFDIHTDGTLNI